MIYKYSRCSSLSRVELNSNALVSKEYSLSSSINDIFGSQVTEYIIGDNVKSIGGCAFYGCTGMTSITIPESVTSIAGSSIRGCTSLTSITIPESVTSLPGYVFEGCNSLTSVIIPESMTSIDKAVFSGCGSLTSITIPNNMTSIGAYAFRDCSSLTSITIPNSVISIGNNAFDGCSSLTTVTVEWNEPISITSDTFTNRANAKLYVPTGTLATYEGAVGWKEFGNIVETFSEMTLIDDEDYGNSNEKFVEQLHYSRTFKNTNWQAWYVPFNLTLTSEVMEHFAFAKFAGTYTEEDGSFYITVVRMKEGDVVKANTPYCVQAKVADNDNPQVITQADVTLKAANVNSFYVLSAEKKITFFGNYIRRDVTAEDTNLYALRPNGDCPWLGIA